MIFPVYQLDKVHLHKCQLQLEKRLSRSIWRDYHVGPFHPGLGSFVTTHDLQWDLSPQYSVQTVGVSDKLGKPGTDTYKKWHDVVLQYRKGVPPKYGAIWLTYYPNVMVEWYPHVLVVSTLHPQGPDRTLNVVEFFYPEEICAFERDFIEAQQAAYMETCVEDDEIALRMDARPQGADAARRQTNSAPTRAPWKTACSIFTSGTAAPWAPARPRR